MLGDVFRVPVPRLHTWAIPVHIKNRVKIKVFVYTLTAIHLFVFMHV